MRIVRIIKNGKPELNVSGEEWSKEQKVRLKVLYWMTIITIVAILLFLLLK